MEDRIDGLCGSLTGLSTDDKAKPDGSLAHTQEDFSDSWTTDDVHTLCRKDDQCTASSKVKAVQICEAVR